jgi:hypothetical protein
MASELLEFEDDDEANENSTLGSKRHTPPQSVQSLERKEVPSKFKQEHLKNQILKAKKKDLNTGGNT